MLVRQPGPPETLRLEDGADPIPDRAELLIDVTYAGVGFVDTLLRAGVFDLPLPLIPGIEVSGRVRACGSEVERVAVGDQVVALLNDFGRKPRAGGYAQLAVAHASMVAHIPEGLDPARAAASAVNGATAWIALRELARIASSDRVLVLGATGGLGSIAARIAAVTPAPQVVGVVGSERRRHLAPDECTEVIAAPDLMGAATELTNGEGFDVIVDPVGGDLRDLAFQHLAAFGRLLVLGNASGDDRRLSADAAWLGSRQVIGFSLGGVAHLIPDRVSAALESVVALLARGAIGEQAPAVRPLEEAPIVHRELEERQAPTKTVLALD
jgi:NADPH:quinone reductase